MLVTRSGDTVLYYIVVVVLLNTCHTHTPAIAEADPRGGGGKFLNSFARVKRATVVDTYRAYNKSMITTVHAVHFSF